MKRRAIIFGTTSFAEVVDFYLGHDSDYEVVGFTASGAHITGDRFCGRPLVPFETVAERFPPDGHDMFVAVGYRQMNRLRQMFCEQAREKGYRLLSYICSKATHWGDTQISDNVFIFEDNTIQPFVSIGAGSVLWSGNHIGHHTIVGDYCFITSHVVVSGNCLVGDRVFLGVNATVADGVRVAAGTLVGPGALIKKDTEEKSVYVADKTTKFPRDSTRFFR